MACRSCLEAQRRRQEQMALIQKRKQQSATPTKTTKPAPEPAIVVSNEPIEPQRQLMKINKINV